MTPSTTTVDLNVGYPNIATVVHAVQGDNQSRILTANLYDGGIAWTPPAGAIGVIKFRTPLGTSGMYDTDEEGNTAVTWSGNVATLRIVQNALAVAGDVPMQLSFYDGNGAVLTTFLWETLVQPSVLTDTQFMQTDYYNILSQQIAAIITAVANIPEPSTTTPKMDGTAAVGTEAKYARGDHVHPTDTSRAPTNHASTGTTYGAGNASNYGHVKLSDSTSTTSGTSGGTAATPKAVKAAYDKANAKPDLASTAPQMDGTSAVGTGTTAARADHVHPSDTSRVPTTRKVNNKALSADITLTAEDIGYDDGLSVHATGSTGKAIADLKGSLNTLDSDATALENAENAMQNALEKDKTFSWQQGSIDSSGAEVYNTTRIRTTQIDLSDVASFKVSSVSGTKHEIDVFGTDNTIVYSSSWQGTENVFVVDHSAHSYVRFILANNDSSLIVPSEGSKLTVEFFADVEQAIKQEVDNNKFIINGPGAYGVPDIASFAGYITGSGNYADFTIPVSVSPSVSRSQISASFDTSLSAVFVGSTRIQDFSGEISVVSSTRLGITLEAKFNSTQQANTECTVFCKTLILTVT